MKYTRNINTPLGPVTLASDGKALCGLWFDGQKYYARGLGEREERDLPVLRSAEGWLKAYFEGIDPGPAPALSLEGSAFQKAVWNLLLGIPAGTTVSYGDLAEKLAALTGRPVSAQAVGGAVGRNPVSIIVPCHRVVGRSGSLTGYAGGLERKLALLKLEGADTSGLFIPEKGGALQSRLLSGNPALYC